MLGALRSVINDKKNWKCRGYPQEFPTTDEYKNWPNICRDLLQQADMDKNITKLITTAGMKWIYGYVKWKQHPSQWKSQSFTQQTKAWHSRSNPNFLFQLVMSGLL
jgi:hypothetical protein